MENYISDFFKNKKKRLRLQNRTFFCAIPIVQEVILLQALLRMSAAEFDLGIILEVSQ